VVYHSTIAYSIEELNKDNLEKVVGELAFHYCNCGNKKKAILYLMKAAEKAKKENSNEKAIRFYNKALEFEEDENNKSKILEEVEDINKMIRDYEKVTT
jgi:tetratricopeptide (TPR) repeat protein